MYWQIGQVIQEEEQQGKERADYGEFLIKSLSEILQPQFGSGFSVRQLEMWSQFYRSFPNKNALRSQFNWTHYRTLIRIENQDKKEFYIAEAAKNNWTARQLERQVNSQLSFSAVSSKSRKVRRRCLPRCLALRRVPSYLGRHLREKTLSIPYHSLMVSLWFSYDARISVYTYSVGSKYLTYSWPYIPVL